MGYTQGINFIVGYLIIIGYSDQDVFWIFIQLAIHPNYLLLGLFEDSFPLSNVYMSIFKRILKRLNPKLYHHLIEKHELPDSIWIFKWFITYYLYSFPIEVCKYIFELVINLRQGGIGLVYFAIGLINSLEEQLLQLEDQSDISLFFQDLKELEYFNEIVQINRVMLFAYNINLTEDDLQDVLKDSFYG